MHMLAACITHPRIAAYITILNYVHMLAVCVANQSYMVVVCFVLSGKELHTQVGVDRAATSRRLYGVIVRILTRNARKVGSIPVLSAIFSIFITPHDMYRTSQKCTHSLTAHYSYIFVVFVSGVNNPNVKVNVIYFTLIQ